VLDSRSQEESLTHVNMHDIPALSLDDSPALRFRLSAEIMEVTAAPGFLRFLADLDGIRLPQDLNVSMMGRTRLSGKTYY